MKENSTEMIQASGGSGGGGKRTPSGTPIKMFKSAKKARATGRRIEVDEAARVVRVFGTVFMERGILQYALGSAAREAGQGFVYDRAGVIKFMFSY